MPLNLINTFPLQLYVHSLGVVVACCHKASGRESEGKHLQATFDPRSPKTATNFTSLSVPMMILFSGDTLNDSYPIV